MNYTFRMHDPRVGRFFATDPLEAKFPFYSPYQFTSNSPIMAVELEGLESSATGTNVNENGDRLNEDEYNAERGDVMQLNGYVVSTASKNSTSVNSNSGSTKYTL